MRRTVVGGAVGGMGLLLAVALLCPAGLTARAEDMTVTKQTSTTTRTLVRPVLSVALSPLVEMEVVPTSNGTVSRGMADLRIATNSDNGFAVLMQGVRGTDMTSLTTDDKIATITEAKALGEFANNSWGYYIGENEPGDRAEYHPIPGTTTEITSTTTSTENQSYKVAFGTKINTGLTAGTYSNEVLISVVANPLQIAMLEDLHFMQDMTPEICAATTSLEVTKELVDMRDNKTYKVAKLKDGNCWMQEDLKLNLSTERQLTPADSDVSEGWTPASDTYTTITNLDLANDNKLAKSWNINGNVGNQWYYTAPAATAGSYVGTAAAVAKDSICPKGWKLPLSGVDYATTNGSFNKLWNTYGITSATTNRLLAAPLNFEYFNESWRVAIGGAYTYGGSHSKVFPVLGKENILYYPSLEYDKSHGSPSFSASNAFYGFVRCVAPVK